MKKLSLVLIACLTSSVTAADQPESNPVGAETRGDQIIREWIAGNRETTSVRGKVRQISYDNLFHNQRTSAGGFGYSHPGGYGFLNLKPVSTKVSHRTDSNGKPYQIEKGSPWPIRRACE